jgi:hypothetical protein
MHYCFHVRETCTRNLHYRNNNEVTPFRLVELWETECKLKTHRHGWEMRGAVGSTCN